MGGADSKSPSRCLESSAAICCSYSCLEGVLSSCASARRSHTGTPLPHVPHLRLRRRDVFPRAGGRLVIVGDVHGCAAELRLLLEEAAFRASHDTLVLVGDLVNKGPSSAEVVQLARECHALCVRGNHDDQALEAWYRVGRYSGDRLGGLPDVGLSGEDVRWLEALPLSISFPWLSLVVVHAGLVPGIPLRAQSFRDLLWIRDVRQNESAADCGGFWEGLQTPVEGSRSWASAWPGPEHVVFGHDAKRKLQMETFATGLDTGCCYGFALTALVVDADDFGKRSIVQVPAARMYSRPADHKV